MNGPSTQPASTGDELIVTAKADMQYADWIVRFTHNQTPFQPWAYPMPRNVAQRIERAVSSYAPLVEALRAAMQLVNDAASRLNDPHRPVAMEIREICTAALKAATGGAQ